MEGERGGGKQRLKRYFKREKLHKNNYHKVKVSCHLNTPFLLPNWQRLKDYQ